MGILAFIAGIGALVYSATAVVGLIVLGSGLRSEEPQRVTPADKLALFPPDVYRVFSDALEARSVRRRQRRSAAIGVVLLGLGLVWLLWQTPLTWQPVEATVTSVSIDSGLFGYVARITYVTAGGREEQREPQVAARSRLSGPLEDAYGEGRPITVYANPADSRDLAARQALTGGHVLALVGMVGGGLAAIRLTAEAYTVPLYPPWTTENENSDLPDPAPADAFGLVPVADHCGRWLIWEWRRIQHPAIRGFRYVLRTEAGVALGVLEFHPDLRRGRAIIGEECYAINTDGIGLARTTVINGHPRLKIPVIDTGVLVEVKHEENDRLRTVLEIPGEEPRRFWFATGERYTWEMGALTDKRQTPEIKVLTYERPNPLLGSPQAKVAISCNAPAEITPLLAVLSWVTLFSNWPQDTS